MADDERFIITSEPSVTPEQVERRTFSTAFRKGFDQNEVRAFLFEVAKELRTAHDRERGLRRAAEAVEQRPSHIDDFDDAMVLERLGEETARILRNAHEAAGQIRQNAKAFAEQSAAATAEEIALANAEFEAASTERLLDLEMTVADRLAECDREVEARLAEATERALEVRRTAEADAERFATETLERCRALVNDAQAARERLLRDLARRGRIASSQVEQLKTGRERLLDAYRTVRRTLDEVTDNLQRADAEARAASDEVAARSSGQAERQPSELIEELGLDVGIELPSEVDEILVSWSTLELLGSRPHLVALDGGEGQPRLRVVPALEGIDVALDEEEDDDAVAGAEDVPIPGQARPRPRLEAVRGEVESDHDDLVDDDVIAHEIVAITAVDFDRDGEPEAMIVEIDEPGGRAADVDGEVDVVKPRRAEVDELFARLRAERETATAEAQQVLANQQAANGETLAEGSPVDSGELDDSELGEFDEVIVVSVEESDVESSIIAIDVDGDGTIDAVAVGVDVDGEGIADESAVVILDSYVASEFGGIDDEQAISRRDALLEPISERLSRGLKRVLQDEENELLHAIRTPSTKGRGKKGAAPAAPTAPDATKRREALIELATVALSDAGAAGAGFAGGVGNDQPIPAEVELDDLVEAVIDTVVGELDDALASELAAGDTAADPDDDRDLLERVSATYREWRLQRVEPVAADAANAAFSRGSVGVIPAGSLVRWVVDHGKGDVEGARRNASVGAVPVGQRFPTGHTEPPCDEGCSSVLVVAKLAQ